MFTGLKIQFEITDPYLDNMIAQDHELVKLKKILDWKALNRIYKECYPSRKGRSTKNTDLVIGLLLLKHFYNLSWERLICGLHENIAMMYFCSVSFMAVVESKKRSKNLVTKSTMIKIMKRLGADRVKRLETNFREQLRKAGAIKGETLITDTTSLEKNIAFPTEIDLLGRVIEYGERIIQKVDRKAKLVKSGVIRKAKQTAKIFYSAGQKTKELLEKMSGRLLKMAVEQMAQAERIYQKASETVKKKLRKTYEALDTTGRKVIRQIRKKLAGENIPDRIVNFHESHVRALPKGKIHKPCEFGTKVRIDMTGNGYVTNYQNYLGNPNDATMTEDAVKAHAKKYGKEFKFATADRGFANREMEQRLEFQLGIKMVIPGKKESTSTLKGEEKKIYNSRAAIEAKISEGKRCVGLDKCLYHGYEGDQICTALGVFALNARKLMRDLRENPKLMMAFT